MQSSFRNATLLFLLKEGQICLAMKKRGFGKGKWNGVGGKVGDIEGLEDETIEEATIREAKEEIGVDVRQQDLNKVAELTFIFTANPEWNQVVHVFFVKKWKGKPTETEEMRPKWFDFEDIPYEEMWEDDKFWLPLALNENKKIKARFVFGEGNKIQEQKIEVIKEF